MAYPSLEATTVLDMWGYYVRECARIFYLAPCRTDNVFSVCLCTR